MKKKIVMALLVMAMSASVFTGCGNRIEGDGKVQAAMADSVDSQEEKEDIPESGTEESETVESTETEESEDSSISEADTEPSEGSVESSVTGDSDTAKGAKTSTQANGSSTTAKGAQIDTQGNTNTAESDSSSSGTLEGFLDYLNQQRAAMGLSQISWDSGLAAEAQRRAEAVVSNFSHDGAGSYLENLYKGGTNSVADVYSAWYNSPGHQATMLHANASKAGVAFVEVDGYYYVVLVENTETPVMSAQDWNDYKEEAVESGELEHYHVSDEAGSITDVYATPGGGVVTDEQEIEDVEAALRAAGLIP